MEDQKLEEAWFACHRNEINKNCCDELSYNPYHLHPSIPYIHIPRIYSLNMLQHNYQQEAVISSLNAEVDSLIKNIKRRIKMISCDYVKNCITGATSKEKCLTCKNNKKRNYIEDHFVKANDAPIPEKHKKPDPYEGSAEQTKGWKCPVCHEFTSPYVMIDGLCSHCGYPLFLK